MYDKFNKKELQNKLQGFQEGKDYSVSSVENGKQVYDIRSEDLKKSLWGDRIPVWCKVEVYDNEDEHYRGRFEGYENGYHSFQMWWKGESSNPEAIKIMGGSRPGWDGFNQQLKDFFDGFLNNENIIKFSSEVGNIHEGWNERCSFKKGWVEMEKNDSGHPRSKTIGVVFSSPKSCFDCGKSNSERNGEYDEMDGNWRCGECNKKYLYSLNENQKAKDQQITNLQEQLNQKEKDLIESSQQLAIERQAKEKAEKKAEETKIQQEKAQNELIQLREELVQIKQELTQAQEQLKEQMEKSPETNAEQLVEKLGKVSKGLTLFQKLVQKPKLNHQEVADIKNQLDISRQVLAAAAAHTQLVNQAQISRPQVEIKPVLKFRKIDPKINYFPYLVGGLFLFGISTLILGWFLGKRKK